MFLVTILRQNPIQSLRKTSASRFIIPIHLNTLCSILCTLFHGRLRFVMISALQRVAASSYHTRSLSPYTTSRPEQNVHVGGKNEPSRADVNAHRILLTNQLTERTPSLCFLLLLRQRPSWLLVTFEWNIHVGVGFLNQLFVRHGVASREV